MKIPGLNNRHRILIYVCLAVTLLAVTGSFYEIKSDKFGRLAKQFLESLCQRRIEVGDASFNFLGRVTLSDVRIYNPSGYGAELLLYAPKIYFNLGMTGGRNSKFRPLSIRLDSPKIWSERPLALPWNTDNFWAKKPPRTDRPTYSLPISIRNAEIHFTDSRVGASGFSMVIQHVNVDHTVMSDGAELKNASTAMDIALPAGGSLDLLLTVLPNIRQAEMQLKFHQADLIAFRPYYEFFKLINFEKGRFDGTVRLNFDQGPEPFRSGTLKSKADLQISAESMNHPASSTKFENASAHVEYTALMTDTRITIDTLAVHWMNSVINGRGAFSSRNVGDSFLSMEFVTRDARAEDLSFLLCDAAFNGHGPITGQCSMSSGSSGDPGAHPSETPDDREPDHPAVHDESDYNISVNLDRADVVYGNVIQKSPGVAGRLEIAGRSHGRPERISIDLAQSHAELTPQNEGWKLELPAINGADIARHVPAFAKIKDFAVSGPLKASLNLAHGGAISGHIDFTNANADLEYFLHKPPGDNAQLDFTGTFAPERVIVRNWRIALGQSRFTLNGEWTPANQNNSDNPAQADLKVVLDDVEWSDAKKYMPRFFEGPGAGTQGPEPRGRDPGGGTFPLPASHFPLPASRFPAGAGTLPVADKLKLEGAASGTIDVKIGQTAMIHFVGAINFDRTSIEIVNLGKKSRGAACSLRIEADVEGGSRLKIRSGDVSMLGTQLALVGELDPDGYDLTLNGDETRLDGLKTLLESQLWSGLRDIDVSGPGSLAVSLLSHGSMLKVTADLDATHAALAWSDTWVKPAGEVFKIRTKLSQSPEGMDVDKIEFIQGTSTLLCSGKIGSGKPAPLSARMRANIDVPVFLTRARGLERLSVSGRKASEALKLIADTDNRAELNWTLSGSIQEPKLSLMMHEIMTRAMMNSITRQLKEIVGILASPFRLGGSMLHDIFQGDTTPPAPARARP